MQYVGFFFMSEWKSGTIAFWHYGHTYLLKVNPKNTRIANIKFGPVVSANDNMTYQLIIEKQ